MASFPAVDRSKVQLPILKVQPGAQVEATLCDVGPLWFAVHWVNGRQLICSGDAGECCPVCSLGSSRVIGMTLVSCRLSGGVRPFLLEISPLGFSQFEERVRFAGLDLRLGVRAMITRPRARGCLRVDPVGAGELGTLWLDGERRLIGGFSVLYGLPLPTLDESFEDFTVRVRSVVEARCRLAAAKLLA